MMRNLYIGQYGVVELIGTRRSVQATTSVMSQVASYLQFESMEMTRFDFPVQRILEFTSDVT